MDKFLFVAGQVLGRIVLFFTVLACAFGFIISTLWKAVFSEKAEYVSWIEVWREVKSVLSSLICLVVCKLDTQKSFEERKIKPRGQ